MKLKDVDAGSHLKYSISFMHSRVANNAYLC